MTAIKISRRALMAGLLVSPVFAGLGCTPAAWSVLLNPSGTKEATYPLTPLKNHDSKEVRVLVMANQGPGLSWEFAGIDRDVATQIGKKLAEGTKSEKHPVLLIRPEEVDKFKSANSNWKTMHPCRIAEKLKSDYIIDVTITGLGLYQPNSANSIYQGWATCDVTVYEAGIETSRYQYYHKSNQHPSAADSMPAGQYKAFLIERLAGEIASRHMKHTEDSRIAPIDKQGT